MKYPKKVERRPDRIPAVRYPKKVGRRPDRILAMRYLHRPDIIPDVRYPGKVGRRPDRISSGWNERCHVSQGGRLCVQGRGSHATLFREDPTLSK